MTTPSLSRVVAVELVDGVMDGHPEMTSSTPSTSTSLRGQLADTLHTLAADTRDLCVETRDALVRVGVGAAVETREYVVDSAKQLSGVPQTLWSASRFYVSNPTQLRIEILSGVTLGAMAVPQAIAYALMAGTTPTMALYGSAMLPITVGALCGQAGAITATAGATAALIKEMMDSSGPLSHLTLEERYQFLMPTLLLCAGIEFLCGVFGAARLLRLIPHSALMGFLDGLAIIVAQSQFDVFKYCPTGRYDECSSSELRFLWIGSRECWLAIMHAVVAFLVMMLLPKIPRIGHLVPGSFAALLVSIALEEGVLRAGCGVSTRNVGETTVLSSDLPTYTAPLLPSAATSSDTTTMIRYGITLAAVGLIESLLTMQMMCRVLRVEATRAKGNAECFAQAAGNLVCSLFGGMGGCCVIGPSLINIVNGARGRLSAMTTGATMLLIIAVAGPVVSLIPIAGLGGILFAMVTHTFDWTTFRTLRYGTHIDRIIICAVCVLGVLWDLAFGVLLGSGFAALAYVYQSPMMRVETYAPVDDDGQMDAETSPLLKEYPTNSPSPNARGETTSSSSRQLARPAKQEEVHTRDDDRNDDTASPTFEVEMSEIRSGHISGQHLSITIDTPQAATAAAAATIALPDSPCPSPSVVSASTLPQRVYRLTGVLSFANVADFVTLLEPADPVTSFCTHVCLDFTHCRVVDHSALWGVRDVLLAHDALDIRVSVVGFARAAVNAAVNETAWRPILQPVTFAHEYDVNDDLPWIRRASEHETITREDERDNDANTDVEADASSSDPAPVVVRIHRDEACDTNSRSSRHVHEG